MMTEEQTSSQTAETPQWQPLDSLQRRVLGVLIEKAKTTPDSYPLTVNSIKTACNQKSNRKPQMELEADDVMATLDELREMGAVAEVQGDGRISKFRHRAYQWLGVDKVELAVIAELLLRGEQTVGELRGRAARMEPIDGLAGLRPVLASLQEKNLLVEVTPAGRGQIVTHALDAEGAGSESPGPREAGGEVPDQPAPARPATAPASVSTPPEPAPDDRFAALQQRLEALTRRVAELEKRLDAHPIA